MRKAQGQNLIQLPTDWGPLNWQAAVLLHRVVPKRCWMQAALRVG